MAGKAKEKRKPEETAEGMPRRPNPKVRRRCSWRPCCFAWCRLARAFSWRGWPTCKTPEAYEPEYKDEDEALGEDMEDGKEGKDDHAEKGNGITDPLAKDGHEAEKAEALKAKDEGGHGEATHDSGLLDFGEMLTNIEGYDVNGAPTRALFSRLIWWWPTDQKRAHPRLWKNARRSCGICSTPTCAD